MTPPTPTGIASVLRTVDGTVYAVDLPDTLLCVGTIEAPGIEMDAGRGWLYLRAENIAGGTAKYVRDEGNPDRWHRYSGLLSSAAPTSFDPAHIVPVVDTGDRYYYPSTRGPVLGARPVVPGMTVAKPVAAIASTPPGPSWIADTLTYAQAYERTLEKIRDAIAHQTYAGRWPLSERVPPLELEYDVPSRQYVTRPLDLPSEQLSGYDRMQYETVWSQRQTLRHAIGDAVGELAEITDRPDAWERSLIAAVRATMDKLVLALEATSRKPAADRTIEPSRAEIRRAVAPALDRRFDPYLDPTSSPCAGNGAMTASPPLEE